MKSILCLIASAALMTSLALGIVLPCWGEDLKDDFKNQDSWIIMAQEKYYELDETDEYNDYKILPYNPPWIPPWIDLGCNPKLHNYSVWSGNIKIENRLDYTDSRTGKEYDIFEFDFENLVVNGGEGKITFSVESVEHHEDLKDGRDSWSSNFTEWGVPGGEVTLAIDAEGCFCDLEIDLSQVEVFRPDAERHDWVTDGVNRGPDYWDVRVMGDYKKFEKCVIIGKRQIGFVWKDEDNPNEGESYKTEYKLKLERTDIE